jgi:hypothetical protein
LTPAPSTPAPSTPRPSASTVPVGVAPTPTETLWEALAQPVDRWGAAEALVGLSRVGARLVAAVLLLASAEAEALLEAMPTLSRSLSLSTVSRPERSSAEVRGPILWSETMAARAASGGDPSTFVFSIAARAYDTAENRVLVSALRALGEASAAVDTRALRNRNAELATIVVERATGAHRWLEHRAFADVTPRATRRDLHRTRAGARHRAYRVALDLLRRQGVPLTGATLAGVADADTRAQHRGLVTLLAELRRRGADVDPLRVSEGTLEGGPLRYVHGRSRRGRAGETTGIFLDERSVDHLLVQTSSGAAAVLDRAGL